MNNNVIILGAGFSFDSGIPLLGGFVEKMWEFAVRKTHNGSPLDQADLEIFEAAVKVKNELDSYHGRAVFSDRNIEDILSLLSFNLIGGGRREKDKIDKINRAIARTIELSCSVKHPGVLSGGGNKVNNTGPELYREFWRNLFKRYELSHDFPSIITFNYDLVLERALLQLLIGLNYNLEKHNSVPFSSFNLSYDYEHCPDLSYAIEYIDYNTNDFRRKTGTILNPLDIGQDTDIKIELLKLHGSLNFPKKHAKTDSHTYNFVKSLDDPQILPPISNKMSSTESVKPWRTAIHRLRDAKNIIIVGYSLPRTDIYMQYFLKAALGPNLNLNKITVFDPVLHTESPEGEGMRMRYQECFSPQLHERIEFHPKINIEIGEKMGCAKQFVRMLEVDPEQILF